ncbi:MAG: 4'-phosphopantetheinyl transferase superfamily protein, partial [Desulfobacterales bacterium]|nr:4'-phosphopantetheinyl transferase superfamily protein [Desulfobacterales bacterium]
VWRARLDPPEARVEALKALLCDDEKERAARFHFERHRRRYIVARGSLRVILGRYLDAAPERPRFSYSEKGKPSLAEEWADARIQFNVSHSHELALYAVGRGRLVGIDVERIRSRPVAEELAERFFTPRECGMILDSPRELKQEVFFNFWTLKEAYLKATGEGVSGLEKIEIDYPASGDPILRNPKTMTTIPGWRARRLPPAEGYAGAVVIQGSGWRLSPFFDVQGF